VPTYATNAFGVEVSILSKMPSPAGITLANCSRGQFWTRAHFVQVRLWHLATKIVFITIISHEESAGHIEAIIGFGLRRKNV
jgi:hypothetical protein